MYTMVRILSDALNQASAWLIQGCNIEITIEPNGMYKISKK